MKELIGIEYTECFFDMAGPGCDVVDVPVARSFSGDAPIVLGKTGGNLIVINQYGQIYIADHALNQISPMTETINHPEFADVTSFSLNRFVPDDCAYDMRITIRPFVSSQ